MCFGADERASDFAVKAEGGLEMDTKEGAD
jgi:hypothetical protein